ncbi:MAG TPA: methyltransferase domain-containing protein [Parafilimonas sp.]|nr:methyltransferase domain-containing protein [Parafilimonas sp.]
MGNNYNSIANIYDVLSRIVFGKSIMKAQIFLLKYIPENSRVLIVGGGTGWILSELSKMYEKGIEITYVEKSAKMIALSKQKNIQHNSVEFINAGIEEFPTGKKFDIIFTAFLFDNFLPEKIEFVFSKLNQLLKPNGLWLYADFMNDKMNSKWWQKFLLKTMYLFFKITCNIETQQLINMNSYFSGDYNKLSEKYFYSGFIKSVVYKKV